MHIFKKFETRRVAQAKKAAEMAELEAQTKKRIEAQKRESSNALAAQKAAQGKCSKIFRSSIIINRRRTRYIQITISYIVQVQPSRLSNTGGYN